MVIKNNNLRRLFITLSVLLIVQGLFFSKIGYKFCKGVWFPTIVETLSNPAKLFSIPYIFMFHILGVNCLITGPFLVIGGIGLFWMKNWARKILLFTFILNLLAFLDGILIGMVPVTKIPVQLTIFLVVMLLQIYLFGFSRLKAYFVS